MRLRVIGAFLVLAVSGLTGAVAQDVTITNLEQLTQEAFSANSSLYLPSWTLWQWRAYPTYNGQPLWVDCSQLPCLDLLQTSTNILVSGVAAVPVWLTKDIVTGETLVQSDSATDVVARVIAPSGYQIDQQSAQDRMVWRTWQQGTNCPDCWGIEGEFPTPTVLCRALLADVNDYGTYASNVEAEAEAAAAAWASSVSSFATGSRFALMDDMSDPCSVPATNTITSVAYNLSNNIFNLTFPSCPTMLYPIYVANVMDSPTPWEFRESVIGSSGSTTWTDTNITSAVSNRFYKLALSPLPLIGSSGDGFTYLQDYYYGVDPLNPYSGTNINGTAILDGPYNTNQPSGFGYSLSGVPGAYLVNSNVWLVYDPNLYTSAPWKTVAVNINAPGGDDGTESFDVSSRGRPLRFADGSIGVGFGQVNGGIYFNHDATNLYIGVAGFRNGGDNALLLLLDTTGGTGGVSTLANLGTLTTPNGLTQNHNLSFGSGFTPNVGILVGNNTADGGNYPTASIGSVQFGQGVYLLTNNTTVADFPGFASHPGAAITQWGDAGSSNANAGIEIALPKSQLGLGSTGTLQAAAIVMGGHVGGNNNFRYFSGLAWGSSVSGNDIGGGNFGTNQVVLTGAPVTLTTKTPPANAPFAGIGDNDVLMQGFYYNMPTPEPFSGCTKYSGATDLYSALAAQAVGWKANGFTAVWMPPPQKGGTEGADSSGYDPYDFYDLGNSNQNNTTSTRYGSFTQLTNAITTLSGSGIAPYVDIVMGQTSSGGQISNYTNVASGYFKRTASDYYIGASNLVDFPFHRDINFDNLDEVNQTVPHMEQALEAWGEWLTGVVGYQGYRIDHSNGMEPWFQSEWLRTPSAVNNFAVLEYNNGASPRELQTWANLVDQRASLFDFPLRDTYLLPLCTDPTFNMATLTNAMSSGSLVGLASNLAVTFVESHDSIRPPCDCNTTTNIDNASDHLGVSRNKMLAYAYILTAPGYPMIQYHDYYYSPYRVFVGGNCQTNYSTITANTGFVGEPLGRQIDSLILARKRFVSGSWSYLPQSGSSNNVFVAKRDGDGNKPGCILVLNKSNATVNVTIPTGWDNGTNVVDYVGNFTNVVTDASSNITFSALATNYAVYVRQPAGEALDNAGYYNSGSWTNTSNRGWGYGAWSLARSSTDGSKDGFFTGSSTGNDAGATPGIDTVGVSWGLYANSGNTSVAYRAFSPMTSAGSQLRIDMDNGSTNASGVVGFALRTNDVSSSAADFATSARFQFYFTGGNANYTIWDFAGAHDSGIPFTSSGLRIIFTLASIDTYRLIVINIANGASYDFIGTLDATAGTNLRSIALFNNNAGSGSSNDAFFNSLRVVGP